MNVCYVPRTYDMSSRFRIVFQTIYQDFNLINSSTFTVGPRTPLMTINRSNITIFVRPFVPD